MASDRITLEEALRSTDRPTKVVLFADLAGSTEMKSRTGEVGWLPTIGKFLDITTTATIENGGTVVKYLGDGILAVFDGDHAAEAICAAIRIQEMLRAENAEQIVTDCLASVGIATGRVVEYQAPAGGLDYVGSVVDLAARLCAAGNPQAIWVDSATVAAAIMTRVTSEVGRVHGFSSDDYLSDEWKVELKGFPKPIRYREVIWHTKPFGARNETVDQISERPGAHADRHGYPAHAGPAAGPVRQPAPVAEELREGVVKRWDPVRGQGFIATLAEGDYYIDRRFVANGEDLAEGHNVRFVPRPPFKADGSCPVAGCAVQEGHVVRGVFQRVLAHKGYGFVDVLDQMGNRQSLYVHLGARVAEFHTGGPVTIEAVRNYKGISGRLADGAGTAENGGADHAA
ncbi:adenylate/guanylate cyclase domain-containing protein [Streptomyces sp. NPDC055815]